MRAIALALVLLACSMSVSNSAFAEHGSLKLYRTYYFAYPVAPVSHQFEIWVNDGDDWSDYYVNVKDPKALARLTRQDFRETGRVYLDAPLPPSDLTVPNVVRNFEEPLLNKIQSLFPDGKSVRVGYSGFSASVQITEFTPTTLLANDRLAGAMTVVDFRVTDKTVEQVFGSQVSSTYRAFDPNHLFEDDALDVLMPPALEGSSLLARQNNNPLANEARAGFYRALQDYANTDKQRVTREENLKHILHRQGPEVIPLGLRQMIGLEITVYTRSAGALTRPQFFTLLLPTQDLIAKKVSAKVTDASSGIRLEATGGFSDLQVRVSHQGGRSEMIHLAAEPGFSLVKNSADDHAILGPLRWRSAQDLQKAVFHFGPANRQPALDIHLKPSSMPQVDVKCDNHLAKK